MVVDILAEELHWDKKRKEQELEQGARFLGTMGLPPSLTEKNPFTWKEESTLASLLNSLRSLVGLKPTVERRAAAEIIYSRAQFEAGEIEELRTAFSSHVKQQETSGSLTGSSPHIRVPRQALFDIIKGLSNFDAIKPKDYEYVLEEAGFAKQAEVDFDEFVEVCRPVYPRNSIPGLTPMLHCRSVLSFARSCSLRGSPRLARQSAEGSPLRRAVVGCNSVVEKYVIVWAPKVLLNLFVPKFSCFNRVCQCHDTVDSSISRGKLCRPV